MRITIDKYIQHNGYTSDIYSLANTHYLINSIGVQIDIEYVYANKRHSVFRVQCIVFIKWYWLIFFVLTVAFLKLLHLSYVQFTFSDRYTTMSKQSETTIDGLISTESLINLGIDWSTNDSKMDWTNCFISEYLSHVYIWTDDLVQVRLSYWVSTQYSSINNIFLLLIDEFNVFIDSDIF